jgi:Peptidase propeptide and YPEB domain
MRLVLLVLLGLVSLGAARPGALAEGRSGTLMWIAERPSLGAVLRTIGQRYPGRALAAHVIERDGRSLYRIKWLGADGKVRDITADARTGEILRVH